MAAHLEEHHVSFHLPGPGEGHPPDALPSEDLTARIAHDHRLIEALFDQLSEADPQRPVLDAIVRELSQHAAAEEEVVYPELATAGDGDHLRAASLTDHRAIEDLLVELQDAVPGTEGLDTTVDELRAALRAHVAEEEAAVLPALAHAIGDERMHELAADFDAARRRAPTRPHPLAPDTPPANKVVDAIVAPVDRLRDGLRG
ncbi:MAG: hemerythrin domain-containing protein [Acidimicrobiales bacterium]